MRPWQQHSALRITDTTSQSRPRLESLPANIDEAGLRLRDVLHRSATFPNNDGIAIMVSALSELVAGLSNLAHEVAAAIGPELSRCGSVQTSATSCRERDNP